MTIKLLIKWKQLDAAKNLILRWQERKDLANDADLHHLIAMYHQKLGNDKDEINHLKYAIGLDPLMIDSIVALAESLERRGVLRMATRLWEILAKADLAVTANFKYRYLRCMVNDNNVREAKKELEAFYPGGITDEATRLLFADLQKTG